MSILNSALFFMVLTAARRNGLPENDWCQLDVGEDCLFPKSARKASSHVGSLVASFEVIWESIQWAGTHMKTTEVRLTRKGGCVASCCLPRIRQILTRNHCRDPINCFGRSLEGAEVLTRAFSEVPTTWF